MRSLLRRLQAGLTAVTAVTVLSVLCGPAVAAAGDAVVIYRWVDKQGRVHFADTVPDAYKAVARPFDAGVTAPSPEEKDRALERAASEKARAAAVPAALPTRTRPPLLAASSPASSAASVAAAKRPPSAPTQDTDCVTWRRLFRESGECFGPYRTANGGVKAEAFDHCTPVTEPPQRCGRNLLAP